MFLAHKSQISNNGYKPIEQLDNRYVLTAQGLVSNVCPHQKSLISTVSGTGNRICPYHQWSFSLKGEPLGSGRTLHYCRNENFLETKQTYEWNNLLFSKAVNFDIPVSFDGMTIMEERIDIVNASVENIMDLFLDVDHIPAVHKGVYDRINLPNINEVQWRYYEHGSVQTVPTLNALGAIWIAVYPNTMIEWQPGALFVTVATPISTFESKVFVFKYQDINYPESTYALNEDVWETAWEQDKTQASLITEFNYSNLEESKEHFRNWLSANRSN